MPWSHSFNEERQRKARSYLYRRLSVSLFKYSVLIVLGLFVIGLRLPAALTNFVDAYVSERWLHVVLFILVGYGLFWTISLPFNYYGEYVLLRKFGLSFKTLSDWFRGRVKTSILSFFLLLLVFEVLYNFISIDPLWLLTAATIIAVFTVCLAYKSPATLEDHFFNNQRLRDEDLLNRFTRLVKKARMKNIQLCEIKTEASREAIADSNGVGNSRRISLSDTLLSIYSKDEIESIIGHEIGHHKYGHNWKFAAVFSLVLLFTFFVTYHVVQIASALFGTEGIFSISSLPLLALTFGLVFKGSVPLMNTLSRWAEGLCDQYELDLVEKPHAYISSIVKLSDQNLRYAYPHKLIEFLFYDHPSGKKRADRALPYIRSRSFTQ